MEFFRKGEQWISSASRGGSRRYGRNREAGIGVAKGVRCHRSTVSCASELESEETDRGRLHGGGEVVFTWQCDTERDE